MISQSYIRQWLPRPAESFPISSLTAESPMPASSTDDLVQDMTDVPQNTDQHVEDLTGVPVSDEGAQNDLLGGL